MIRFYTLVLLVFAMSIPTTYAQDKIKGDIELAIVLNPDSAESAATKEKVKEFFDAGTQLATQKDLISVFDAFKARRETRARVIVIIQTSTVVTEAAKEKAKLLYDDYVFIYVVKKSSVKFRAIDYTGSKDRIFDNATDEMREKIRRDMCSWTTTCYFLNDQRSTYGKHVEPHCKELVSTEKCSYDDTRKDCDRRWPWTRSPDDCEKICPVETVARVDMKRPKYAEHCPTEFKCSCSVWLTRRNIMIIMGVVVIVLMLIFGGLCYWTCRKKLKKSEKVSGARSSSKKSAADGSKRASDPASEGESKKKSADNDYILVENIAQQSPKQPVNDDYIMVESLPQRTVSISAKPPSETEEDAGYVMVETVEKPKKKPPKKKSGKTEKASPKKKASSSKMPSPKKKASDGSSKKPLPPKFTGSVVASLKTTFKPGKSRMKR